MTNQTDFPAVMPTYNRAPVLFERGEGPYLFTEEGDRYLDMSAGIAVNCLGHCHPYLINALNEQANKLWHTANSFVIPQQEKLAQRMVDLTFADTVFFTNSGVEAWECAVKTIRSYFSSEGSKRYKIITAKMCFHGRSMGAISASEQAKMTKGFDPLLPGFSQVDFGDLEAAAAAIDDETAAILVEPVQGEGGILPGSVEYLQGLRKLCDEHDILLCFDEIQCGYGRTGKLFAYEWADMQPDVLCSAKGIGGGFPLGACLATKEAARGMVVGTHGSTYGGNPLAMAVGNAVLDKVADADFLANVRKTSDLFMSRLELLKERFPDIVVEVRGKGLMLGLRLSDKVSNIEVVGKLRDNKMITVAAAQNVVRMLPPLIIDETQIDEALSIFETTFAEL